MTSRELTAISPGGPWEGGQRGVNWDGVSSQRFEACLADGVRSVWEEFWESSELLLGLFQVAPSAPLTSVMYWGGGG